MRQYTTPEQTAKLIELGFEKPRVAMPIIEWKNGEPQFHYTIGELIEMLPEVLAPSNNDDYEMPLSISTDSFMWTVEYDGDHFSPYEAASIELIDALYDMCVKLKERGVI
jgi:hypothetical protein